MDKIKVLMIDDNVNLIEMVKEYFKNNDKIDIVLEFRSTWRPRRNQSSWTKPI